MLKLKSKTAITSTNKIKVDGIDGVNIAELYLDQRNSDYYPPVLQALQTLNKDGRVSIHFDKASDGELRIVGGDFNAFKTEPDENGFFNIKYNMWYEMASVNQKVEYAPRGTDNFMEISAPSDDNDYKYWGFNDFYRIPLDVINAESDDKWYDLRITFTDEAGNHQRQLLSPAFRIENVSTSVERVNINRTISVRNGVISIDGMENPAVTVYDMSGRKVLEVIDNRINVNGMAEGVYIIEANDGNGVKTAKFVL